MNLYFYTREIIATGKRETLPFNSSHHVIFAEPHEHIFPIRAFGVTKSLVDHWNTCRPDLYRYEIAPTRCGVPI